MTGKKLSIGLFGAGRIGAIHGRNIADHPDCRLTYVVDPSNENAAKLSADLGATIADEATVLADKDVDAIVICSATDTHADLIEKGMKAGKVVFCEKPIDLSLVRIDALLAEIANSSAPLFVAFNRRFDPAIMELQSRLSQGQIGDVELITIISKDPEAPPPAYIKVSGGMFRDMTIHDFDMARFLLVEEPAFVHATASSLVDPAIAELGDIDTAAITLQTASGKIAVITNSRRASFGYDQRVEVLGSNGMLSTENVPTTTLVQSDANGVAHANPMNFFLERYAQSYRNEWRHFVAIMKGDESPLCNGEDGRKALVLAEAAYESMKTGRTVEVSF